MPNMPMNYLRMAQAPSPYDEDQFMPAPFDQAGIGEPNLGYAVQRHGLGQSPLNAMLNNRLLQRFEAGRAGNQQRGPMGSDSDMEMIYGPEDQVAFDNIGRPIPLADPRHPRNQQMMPNNLLGTYPQRGSR